MSQAKRHLFRKHLSDGELRAMLDQPAEDGLVDYHLETCPACRNHAKALATQAQRVENRLDQLETAHDQANPSIMKTAAARRKLEGRLQQTEEIPMFKNLTQRISRPAWAAIALVAVLAIALAFPPVRAAANSFLQLFRVEQVRVIPIDMDTLNSGMESSAQFESLFAENVDIQENGDTRETTDAAEAAALSGLNLRLPAGEAPERFLIQPGGTATLTVNLEMAHAVLREIGRSDVQLPAELDGAKVKIEIPTGVAALLGRCESPDGSMDTPQDPNQRSHGRDWDSCTTLMQMPSPVVSAPPDLDLQALGKVYMQVLGMSEEEADLFASNVNWATTFVVPVPRNEADYSEVQVDGVTGTLITFGQSYRPGYTLLWIKNEMVYFLTGDGTAEDALQLAATIQ